MISIRKYLDTFIGCGVCFNLNADELDIQKLGVVMIVMYAQSLSIALQEIFSSVSEAC